MAKAKKKRQQKKKHKKAGRATEFSAQVLEQGMEAANAGYEKILGRWWVGKAGDTAHRHAYRYAVKWLRKRLPEAPASILDYACGAGHLLKRLRKAFPDALLTGYDGSEKLLRKARRRLPEDARLDLVRKILPELDDPRSPVDLTVICLPHLLPIDEGEGVVRFGDERRDELEAARAVVEAMREERHLDPDELIEWQVSNALFERMVALHLWRLTAPGGHALRIDYTEARFDDIAPIYQDYLRFTQGTCPEVCGIPVPFWFEQIADTFRVSDIISDVSDQTEDYEDDGGGYMVRLFRAVDRDFGKADG